MQRTVAGGGTNNFFLVFNLYNHLHMIFEEASAHFVPNTCPAIPVESIHCLWVLVWPAYIKPSKTVDSRTDTPRCMRCKRSHDYMHLVDPPAKAAPRIASHDYMRIVDPLEKSINIFFINHPSALNFFL